MTRTFLGIGLGGDVRRDDNPRIAPDRVTAGSGSGRSRPASRCIRPLSRAAVNAVVSSCAPRPAWIRRAPGGRPSKIGVENSPRVLGQRQQADQDVAAGKKGFRSAAP